MKLNEVMVAPNAKLSHEQLTTLLKIYQAQKADPNIAAYTLKGDIKAMAAGEFLLQQRYVTIGSDGITITKSGVMQLVSAGVVNGNQATQLGAELINPKK